MLRTTQISILLLVTAFLVSPAIGQMTFSIDYKGPTAGAPGPGAGLPDGFGMPLGIDEGQILTTAVPLPPGPNLPAFGPLPPPGIMVDSIVSPMGSVPGGLGIMPGIGGAVEVDALSYGRDHGQQLFFSVDEFAVGVPTPFTPFFPDVFTEGAGGVMEASADVFVYMAPAVITPPGPVIGNTDVIDGDGIAPFGGPGTGLMEPNPPGPGPDFGDNLDAVDIDTVLADLTTVIPGVGPTIFFSMDSPFVDPREGIPNSGTAAGNIDITTGIAFVGGDVAVTTAGGVPVLYAAAAILGLDLADPDIDTDDLDALILLDDGALRADGNPFFSLDDDVIYFSVRAGSAVIGLPDSRFGAPIEPGDVLEPPLVGGVSPFPAIFVSAEALGLSTARAGLAFQDDLDALDIVPEPSALALIGMGLFGLLGFARRRHTR